MTGVTLPAVLLHGFAGTGRSWDAVRAELGPEGPAVVAPDLPGHGTRANERPVSFESCVRAVLDEAPPEFVLCGYSMGGRIALHVALAAPERVRAVVLVSATAGIEDPGERGVRRDADAALADATERGSIDEFIEAWSAQPLFGDDPSEVMAAWHDDMRRNDPAGIAAALRGAGTGVMTPLWDRLTELTMPAQVLAGERDAKYVEVAERLTSGLPSATLTVVPRAGHALPRVAPSAVGEALRAASAGSRQ